MPDVARDGDKTGCGASLISGAARTTVNGRLIVRLGDSSDHGGVVITASSLLDAEGPKVARVGDLHSCPLPGHGITPIVTGSPDTTDGG